MMALTEELHAEQVELVRSLQTPDEARRLIALPVGLHDDVSERVYHARVLGMASKSGLDQLRKSPAHYRAWVDGLTDRDTEAFRFGKAIHRAVLEPEAFATEYVIAPDFGDCRKRGNKLARDAWNKDHAGATILRNSDGIAAIGMVRATVAHPLAGALFNGGAEEVTIRWEDQETGIQCKGRVDLYRQDLATLIDVKSTTDASADAFRRDLWHYGYYRQDAFYREGLRALGAPIEHFVFICVEKTPPHAVALYEIDANALERGVQDNSALLRRLAECIERDEWPGYPETIQSTGLPPWVRD